MYHDVVATKSQVVSSMSEWVPEVVLELHLSGQQLQVVQVGSLVNLSILDLSANLISCLSASGMHNCTNLTKLYLAGNSIAASSEVSWLRYGCCTVLHCTAPRLTPNH